MDGQVAAIRDGLDAAGYPHRRDPGLRRQVRLGLLRPVSDEAVASSLTVRPAQPISRTAATPGEALREISPDIDEGADIVMVKPAMAHLDDVAAAAEDVAGARWRPTQVSGSIR